MPTNSRTSHLALIAAAIFASIVCVVNGCSGFRYDAFPASRAAVELASDPAVTAPRDLPIFSGRDGSPLVWADLLDAGDWAHIIIIGEQHDDAMGHAVQLAVVEDVFDRGPQPTPSALAMEMLERDGQIVVDDFLEDVIDTATFIRLTHTANWGGRGKWEEWFQPIVDAAKDRGGRVIAANAPRRYVRLARLEGYDRLRSLPRQRRATFDLPRARPQALAAYRDRFGDVMRHVHADDDDDDVEEVSEEEAARLEREQERRIDAAFRSQLLWDSTMAASIIRARPSGRAKVIHLVGQFHSDFEGGLVQEIRARLPRARILTISMQRVWQSEMRDDDLDRADIVIYTGERPPRPAPEPEDETADEGEHEAANEHSAASPNARHDSLTPHRAPQ